MSADAVDRLNAALSGRYRIESELGEGGMATVYLAKDLKHNRNVALKVLKPHSAEAVGAERFLAEIETTANLQHPNILQLFDSGEADSFLFYVTPYVEGDTVSDWLKRDKQLPVDVAVGIAADVAEALDYAHRRGVIHRDVKPSNVLLQDGKPVVADFGIALVAEGTNARLTEAGQSLGTTPYMSPEQAIGDPTLGPPADVYSLGCVLYEMLVGEPPHGAATLPAMLAKILTSEAPSAREARSSIPLNVDAAIEKALSALPADRFQTAESFRQALLDPLFRHGEPGGQGRNGREASRWKRVAIGSAAVAGVSLLAAAWLGLADPPAAAVLKVSMALSGEELVAPPNGPAVTVSSDGSTLLYGAFARVGRNDRWQLWARRFDEFDARPLPGTEEGVTPAFSPDGSEVAFTQGGVRTPIQIVPLSGGPRRSVGEGVIRAGISWGPDEMLYYVRIGHGISRIPAAGGTAEIVTTVDAAADETGHRWIDVLPNGRAGVFSIGRSGPAESWDIGVIRFGEDAHRVLTPGLYPRYAASGHLLWVVADGSLMAAPFDAERLELAGPPVVVTENVNLGNFNAADYSVAENGTLVYLGSRRLEDVPVWVARDGTETEVPGDWIGALAHPRVSPDGTQALFGIGQGTDSDIWVKELESGPLRRLTFGSSNYRAEWADRGGTVTFLSDREGQGVWEIPADGSGTATLVHDESRFINEAFVTFEREWLVYRLGSGGGRDLMARRIDGGAEPIALATTPFEESAARVSPDGRWLAYVSDESGQNEIYVRPFPSSSGSKTQVSTAGGREPLWSPDGTELFYRDASNQLIAVGVQSQPTFTVGARQVLFSTVPYKQQITYNSYDVAPDGRFLMIRSLATPGEMKLVQNFFEELKRLAPS